MLAHAAPGGNRAYSRLARVSSHIPPPTVKGKIGVGVATHRVCDDLHRGVVEKLDAEQFGGDRHDFRPMLIDRHARLIAELLVLLFTA